MKRTTLFFLAFGVVAGRAEPAAAAVPIKIACIGEHTTHSHAFPPTNRESQPVGMQEYPAMLQTRLGAGYDVRNFGDCCATVTQGYNTTGQEVHPFIQGTNAGDGPGYNESIAFLPDIVVIGSWGRHDWGKDKPSTETWSLPKFQQDYDDLVQRYMNLSSHPKIFVSLPIPILNGTDMDNGVSTMAVGAAVKQVATKYNLPTIDLYTPFFGHMELYKQPPDSEGEGEHVTDAALSIIADKVYEALVSAADGGSEGGSGPADAADARPDASVDAGAAGAGGAAGGGGSGGEAGASGAGGSGGTSGTSTGSAGSGTAGGATTAGGGAGATTTGAGGASTTGGSTPPSSSNGCSCRITGASDRAGYGAYVAVVAAVALARRIRRRRTS
jgi:MYXO-CTERM domain-containing protein